MRLKTRSVFVALTAVFALSAVGATAAQASEGPFWRVPCHKVSAANKGLGIFDEGCLAPGKTKEWETRLLGGEETTKYKTSVAKAFVLPIRFLGTITCKSMTQEGRLVGSTGANPGVRHPEPVEPSTEFHECTTSKENCQVSKLFFFTLPRTHLNYTLGYAAYGELKERAGKLLVLVELDGVIEVKGQCGVPEQFSIEGSAIGEVWSGGKAVEVGKESPAAKITEVNFPKLKIKSLWVEKAGVVEQKTAHLGEHEFDPTAYEGREEIELSTKEPFGVFTK